MVCALAGRRIDAPNAATPRFPLARIDHVRARIRAALAEAGATTLISSAANGADLIALEEAGALGLRRRVVLPFERARFRQTSVADRPGDWGGLFDRILDEVSERDDLITIAGKGDDDDAAYRAASDAMLREAVRLADAQHEPAGAIIVWDGRSRGADDLTDAFRQDAASRNLRVVEISTL
jgi:hypothetical protein